MAALFESSPDRYVVRLDPASGHELPGAISPDELLIHAHRDRNALQIAVQYAVSRLVGLTGSEWLASRTVENLARLGETARRIIPGQAPACVFRFRSCGLPDAEARGTLERMRSDARAALLRCGHRPRLRILLTGATGFLGQEILQQAAEHPCIDEVVCLVRPRQVRDNRNGRVVRVVGARQRGSALLTRLGIGPTAHARFRFVAGDIERCGLGLSERELRRLERTITHVVHGAASVAFDDAYESSFRTNVLGSRNALKLSLRLQQAAASRFVAHLAVETSYVHGRTRGAAAPEGCPEFPPGYYNNFYELTKAMATLETERMLWQRGLRVVQILPSIVVGHSRTGNNHGDTKVVNAPINAFGRIREILDSPPLGWWERLRALALQSVATAFPADGSAELNLVPVDRVAAGVLSALTAPEAVGTAIHLAAEQRIRSAEMLQVIRQELGIAVRMVDPTVTRNFTLPLVTSILSGLGQRKLAGALARLETIFGVYSEWGQPVHGVGNDVRVLGLPARRPDSVQAFRMLCRHNRYVLEFGKVKDPDEVARRERRWHEAIDQIEFETGRLAAALPPARFRELIRPLIDHWHTRTQGARA
jgi:nucleoside-diphosphate-sugar epimerase